MDYVLIKTIGIFHKLNPIACSKSPHMVVNLVKKRYNCPLMWQCDNCSGPVWSAQLGDKGTNVGCIG